MPYSPREAVKSTIRQCLDNLMREGKIEEISFEELIRVAEEMYNDDTFLEKLEEFFEDYIMDFGENYGI